MTNAIETILKANNIDIQEARGGVAGFTADVCIALNDDDSVTFCDVDGHPVATVRGEGIEAMLGRVTTEDELHWISRWGSATAYDIEAH